MAVPGGHQHDDGRDELRRLDDPDGQHGHEAEPLQGVELQHARGDDPDHPADQRDEGHRPPPIPNSRRRARRTSRTRPDDGRAEQDQRRHQVRVLVTTSVRSTARNSAMPTTRTTNHDHRNATPTGKSSRRRGGRSIPTRQKARPPSAQRLGEPSRQEGHERGGLGQLPALGEQRHAVEQPGGVAGARRRRAAGRGARAAR